MEDLTTLLQNHLPETFSRAKHEYQEAKQKTKELEVDERKLRAENERLRTEIRTLENAKRRQAGDQQRLADLQRILNVKEGKVRETTRAAQEEIMKLQQEKKILEAENTELKMTLGNTRSPHTFDENITCRQHNRSESQTRTLSEQHSSTTKRKDREVVEEQRHTPKLMRQIQMYKNRISEMKARLAEHENCELLHQENLLLRQERRNLELEIADLKKSNSHLECENEKVNKDLQCCKQKLQISTDELSSKTEQGKTHDNKENIVSSSTHKDQIQRYESIIETLECQLEIALDKIKRTRTKAKTASESYEKKITNLKEEVGKLQNEAALRQDEDGGVSRRQLENKLSDAYFEIKEAKKELEDTRTRLSKLMGQKLTDNNPNIADLSDKNRPTKLAERFTELYDNQWTDAFENLHSGDERETISKLLGILLHTMEFCRSEADVQMTQLKLTLSMNEDVLPALVSKPLKDCRKLLAESYGKHLFKRYFGELTRSRSSLTSAAVHIKPFIEECFYVCWLMAVQDPPVVLAKEPKHGDPFNTDLYKAYTCSGSYVDFMVWPALFLHTDGPLLCKGIVQGVKTKKFRHGRKY